jgi:hypothetical protein
VEGGAVSTLAPEFLICVVLGAIVLTGKRGSAWRALSVVLLVADVFWLLHIVMAR